MNKFKQVIAASISALALLTATAPVASAVTIGSWEATPVTPPDKVSFFSGSFFTFELTEVGGEGYLSALGPVLMMESGGAGPDSVLTTTVSGIPALVDSMALGSLFGGLIPLLAGSLVDQVVDTSGAGSDTVTLLFTSDPGTGLDTPLFDHLILTIFSLGDIDTDGTFLASSVTLVGATAAPVPLPASALLLLTAGAGLGFAGRRKARAKA